MKVLRLRSPDGSFRYVELGKPYKKTPGEIENGLVEGTGPSRDVETRPGINQLIKELDDQIGGGAGNWIKRLAGPVAKLVGKEGCSGCEVRRVTANAYAKLKAKYGQAEALSKIKDLWAMSRDKELTLKTLKSYLDD